MTTVYQLKFTDGAGTITVQPGTLNGPGGAAQDTDLYLWGRGTPNWGQGVDQNQLRLLENFACPESLSNPGNPMDESEIGVTGAGINNPIEGQQWFNTTTKAVYSYTGTNWKVIGGVPSGPVAPSSPIEGDLWYDTNIPQLKVYNGSSFVSVALRYLLLTGGTLTGTLTMDAAITFSGADDITLSGGEVLGLPPLPSGDTAAASKKYVDDQIALLSGDADLDFVNVSGDTMTGNLIIQKTSPTLTLNVTNATSDGALTFQESGSNRGQILFDQTSDDMIFRRLLGGSEINHISLRSTFIETHSSNGKIRTPSTLGGDNGQTVTTKDYVDTEIAAATGGLGGNLAEIFEQGTDPGGAAKNGDIWVNGSQVYIKANGVFRKIFPAQYS